MTGRTISPTSTEVNSTQTISSDFAWARERMVREQIIARGISDQRVIEAMRKNPRRLFVDSGLVNRAYDDCALPSARSRLCRSLTGWRA
jgi:hypothetical protein